MGAGLEARYVLAEGDVLSVSAGGECRPGCAASVDRANTASQAPAFAPLDDWDGVNALMTAPVAASQLSGGDVVGRDLADLPGLCDAVSRSFEGDGTNAAPAAAFARALLDDDRRRRASLDLVVVGVECSLWVFRRRGIFFAGRGRRRGRIAAGDAADGLLAAAAPRTGYRG